MFTTENQKNQNKFWSFTTGLILFCLTAFSSNPLNAQCPLACNNLVQVSLERNCQLLITPEMLLQDMGPNPPCVYTVTVYGTNNQPLASPVVTSAHVGKKLKVSVRLGNTNSCWGEILVEDKYAPEVQCPADDTLFCNRTRYLLNLPIVYEACSQAIQHVIEDKMEMFDCRQNPEDSIIGRRVIRYYYTDASGNRSDTCTQSVYFKKFKQSDIVWPADAVYTCDQFDTIPGPDVSGVPEVDGEPIYPSWGACKIAVTYEDDSIAVCSKSFKVIRKWTVLDWCYPNGRGLYEYNQLIKVVDEKGPVVSCTPNLTVSTDVWTCTGTAVIPPPVILQECSNVKLQIGHKPAGLGVFPNFEGVSNANVTRLPNGSYMITNLPLGLNYVVFRAVDDCGNFNDCFTEVEVLDKVPPVPVCDQKTVVSLTLDGTAKIEAFTFDDRSHDNCGISYFEAKRMDNGLPCNDSLRSSQWAQYVHFCCEDIGKTIMVSLRVWDHAGNSNVCMVEVDVQDKTVPFVFCPPDITVSCSFDFTDYNVFGTVRKNILDRKNIVINDPYVSYRGQAIDGYAYDGCGFDLVEKVTVRGNCGIDTIFRLFEATDKGQLTGSCTQRIFIKDFNPENITIDWPADYQTNTVCIQKENIDPNITGRPVIKGKDKCNSVFVKYTDEPFVNDPDACIKIIRNWEVIDWCVYKPNDIDKKGYWAWKQIIKVVNRVPPVITSNCNDRTVDVFGPGCGGHVDLIGYATDDCTDSLKLTWYHEVDLYNDGKPDAGYAGPGRDASGVYPLGIHKVIFRVWDACDNIKVCTFLMTVRDGKKPTPYCHSGIVTTVMPSTKSIAIWAKDYNLNSEDNCTPKDSLKYYFKTDTVYHPSMTFDCSHIGKNLVRMYVFDKAGNSDYCEVTIEIQDPNKVCPNTLTIQGKLATYDNRALSNTEVLLERTNPLGTSLTYTDANGIFSFNTVSSNINYVVKPSKNFDHNNGVSGQDIVMIQRHILGLESLKTPYQIISADANNNGQVTTSDISEIRKIVLGLIPAFSNNKSWRFIPSNFVFKDPAKPFPFTESIAFNPLNQNEMNSNFVAVKIGDVSGNASVNLSNSESSTRTFVDLILPEVEYNSGEQVQIPVSLSQSFTMTGIQLAFEYDPSILEFIGIQKAAVNVEFEEMNLQNGSIKLVHALVSEKTIKAQEEMFTLIFQAKKAGVSSKHLNLMNKELFTSEIYDAWVEANPLDIQFSGSKNEDLQNGTRLFQNSPNPFQQETVFGFETDVDQTIGFTIFDMDGKTIRKTEKTYQKGYHQLLVKASDLPGTGVYYLQMNAQDHSETRKMVYIK